MWACRRCEDDQWISQTADRLGFSRTAILKDFYQQWSDQEETSTSAVVVFCFSVSCFESLLCPCALCTLPPVFCPAVFGSWFSSVSRCQYALDCSHLCTPVLLEKIVLVFLCVQSLFLLSYRIVFILVVSSGLPICPMFTVSLCRSVSLFQFSFTFKYKSPFFFIVLFFLFTHKGTFCWVLFKQIDLCFQHLELSAFGSCPHLRVTESAL